ncbi:cas scaffolding protein family member 4 [Eublepharis macularius]|uniref:Cas scaffolding protein family member 4 n=1 Tax=Eublepharis macularius TaxID=481883 RepID=A0AA97JFQ9_EUBMA|nr:cas scaffolding protein family member 4 [Eublepharis macularius]
MGYRGIVQRFLKNALAKALYDNKAECPDELAFRRGDILTVLEQDPLGSEGWWKCSLHGKQGLAPANRLQLLTPSQAPSIQHDSQGLRASPGTIYQVPSARQSAGPAAPVYERMDSWIKPRSSSLPNQEVYQVPALAAQLLSEKAQSSSNQHLFTLPRATWASTLGSRSDIYDVPSPQRHAALFSQGVATPPSSRKNSQLFPSIECCLEKSQQLYDIPPSPQKARICTLKPATDNVCDSLPTASQEARKAISTRKDLSHYNTLPNLHKSEWIYDIPEKTGLKQTPQSQSPDRHMLYDIPPSRLDSDLQKILPMNSECKSMSPQAYDVPSAQRRLTLPESPLYDVPSTHDVRFLRQNGNYDVPPAVLSSKTEKENHQQTFYDVPKRTLTTSPQKKGVEKCNYNSRDNVYNFPSQLPRDAKSNQDRLSVSSVDSRTSTISTSSSASTESFSSSPSSSSEESNKEATMELDSAIETLTKLQHGVSSSIASLMIFVSSKWRYQENLEGNIEEIRRAVDHIKVSLGEFLDFAQTIEGNAACASDSKLQVRIKKQLSILAASFQILVEMREALNKCRWSLEVLVIKKPQSNPDDLDRFVMVARTVPDDIKRFVSIVIANGKLLFRKNCKENESKELRHKTVKGSLGQRMEDNSLLRNVLDKSKENSPCVERSGAEVTEDCDYIQIQGSPPKSNVLSEQDPAMKMKLSDLCRLCFGAVQKAIGVFRDSLGKNPAPEIFIGQSKLIIMVGQKLVDALCQEALEKATRNEILCGSSKFCSLLKNLAVATKNAAVQYPSAEAMRELQDQADGLLKYIQQFQAMME